MRSLCYRKSGFSLLELLMSMALFAIAAVSLAQAINMISLTVSESIDEAEVREALRAELLEATRNPNLQEETREKNPNDQGIFFRIEVTTLNLENKDAQTLANLFEVRVTALRASQFGGTETLDEAMTWVYPDIF